MQTQIAQLSDVQLKAIAYDELAKIENAQKILQVINNELASRAQKAQEKPKMENETKTTEEEVIDAPATPEEETAE